MNYLYPIKFRTRVIFYNILGSEEYKDFDVFASSKSEAIEVTKELFSVLDGGSIKRIGCKPIQPSDDIGIMVLRGWREIVDKISTDLIGKTYPDILDFFIKYEGFDAEIYNNKIISFKFSVLGYTLKIKLSCNEYKIDQSWGYYRGMNNDTYVIRDNTIYISK